MTPEALTHAQTDVSSDWYPAGLEDDMRPRMFACADRGEAFALATIVAAEGGGPRGVGAQMVITRDEMAGFLSGGCIEADVALHARQVLTHGDPVHLIYGRGSPFVDTRLPCGGRLDVMVERYAPDDPVLKGLREADRGRRWVTLLSDGRARSLAAGDVLRPDRVRAYGPRQRLVVIGADAFALAMAQQGLAQGWAVTLIRPKGPETPPPLPAAYLRGAPAEALRRLTPDPWTAVAIATHDADLDHEAALEALASGAGYVGVLGSRRRLPERLDRLDAAGVSPAALARLRAPIGLKIGARSPQAVAVAVIAEIIEALS
ncbi:MAG: xanthine dehydrogenase accessory factor [Brevundimonas sp.]|jgi:xanthine dehydrogenase accessory factor|uniref:XdhC family protein n=1 Tax=Brevundimonas sp. TaxID=1871086 RepID=UPI0039E485D1